MKMFLIDPETNTVTEQKGAPTLETFYKLMDCKTVAMVNQPFVGVPDILYVDEEGNYKPSLLPFLTPHGRFVGKGIVIGMSRGRECNPSITLSELQAQVFFPSKASK